MESYLEICANTTGFDLSTSKDDEKLKIYKCTLMAIRDLPDSVSLVSIGLETLNTIDTDLRQIIQGLSKLESNSSAATQTGPMGLIKIAIRRAREVLATATVQYNRDDSESADVSDDFFKHIGILQDRLDDALNHFPS